MLIKKEQLRKEALARRRSQAPESLQRDETAINAIMIRWMQHKPPQRGIMAYISTQNEVDITPSIQWAFQQGIAVYLPRCIPGEKRIEIVQVQNLASDICPGCYGIAEPIMSLPAVIKLPDLIFVPGIAFDRQGHRVGFGAGYYDRLLAAAGAENIRIGICQTQYLYDMIKSDDHDIMMHYIITQDGLLNVNRRSVP